MKTLNHPTAISSKKSFPVAADIRVVILDPRCQPRQSIDTPTVEHYAERIQEGDAFPPIKAVFNGESYIVYDGFHRVLAHQQLSLPTINVSAEDGTIEDAIRLSLSANAENGRQRTKKDIGRCILVAWNDLGMRDTNQIADLVRCSVRHVRRALKPLKEAQKEERNEKIAELANKGLSQREIAKELGVGKGTVVRQTDGPKRPLAVLDHTGNNVEEIPESSDEPVFSLTQTITVPELILLKDWDALDVATKKAALSVQGNSKFNPQKTSSIEWAQWSWNPITGCRHDCPYCYARDIALRFYEQKFEPTLLPSRLTAPANTPIPHESEKDISFKNVFTCSMADLFGRWVPSEWIEAVLEQVRAAPQWNFLFLTKFPKRMAEFSFPKNAWLGTSVDCQARVKNAEKAFSKISGGTKWLSVEPMLENLKFSNLSMFDWVVIGGAAESTKTPAWIPPIDWIVDLHQQARKAGCRIYYKTNCGMENSLRIREFPWAEPKQKTLPDVFKYLTRQTTNDQKTE